MIRYFKGQPIVTTETMSHDADKDTVWVLQGREAITADGLCVWCHEKAMYRADDAQRDGEACCGNRWLWEALTG